MQVKKLGYVLFVGVIAAVCILPVAVMPWQVEKAVGNEQLASFPELRKEDGNFNAGILNDFADYFADHFGFRHEMITLNDLIGFPEKIDESHIAAEDLDNRIIYREENGIFIEVQRMPGEEYEDQFASREEYLSSMLSEKQLKELAADLGVPEDLEVRYTQGERSYWEAGGCWEIYVEIDADMKVVAASSVDAETGNLTQNILTYNESGYWEVN